MKIINKFICHLSNYHKNIHLKELISGSAIAFSFKITGSACGLLFSILISRFYGTSGAGIYSISFNVLWFASLLGSLGMDTQILRYAGQLAHDKNLQNVNEVYRTATRMVIPASVLLSVILFAISDHLAISLLHDQSLGPSFKIISIVLPFYVVNSLNIELMRGLKRITISEYYRNVNVFAISIFFVLLLSLLFRHIYIPIISLSAAVAIGAIMSFTHVRNTIDNDQVASRVKPLRKSDMLKTSLPMMVASLFSMLMGNVGTVMLGIYSTTDSAGIYSIAYKISILTTPILVGVSVIAAPKFSELYWSNNRADLINVAQLSSKLIFLLSLPVLLITFMFPELLLGLFGNNFLKGKYTLMLLAVGQLINIGTGLVSFFLNMTGGHVAFRNITISATLLCIGLNLILIPRYDINGAAMATMTGVAVWNIASAFYVRNKFNINLVYMPFRSHPDMRRSR